VQEVENSVFWVILAAMFSQIGKSGKTSGKTFRAYLPKNDK
jgi:hypothetical protein